jgi:hypothetical protein
MIDWLRGEETKAAKAFRVHIGPYLKGFAVGSELKVNLMKATTYQEIEALLSQLDHTEPYPSAVLNMPRGKTRTSSKVFLPAGWLDS